MDETQPTESMEINVVNDTPLYAEPIEMDEGTLNISVLETDKGFAIILQTDAGIAVVDLLDDSAEAIARAMGLAEMFISSIPDEDEEEGF